MDENKPLLFRIENGVGWVTLNRPDRKNAMNPEMRDEMFRILDDAVTNEEIRCLVIGATGDGFCTGADLGGSSVGKGGPPHPGDVRRAMSSNLQRLLRLMMDLEKPIVASVNGVAAGFGAHLAYACDLVVAAKEARFIEVFVRRGLAVDAAGGYILPRRIGLQRAKELVFLGDAISAEEAERFGLVNRVVPRAELATVTSELAERLAKGPTFAIGLSKRLLNKSLESDREAALAEEAYAQTLVTQSEDMKEGIKAFMEKREPVFKGR
jgi:2-(1,2-epoxy-1,2-dihydrophenyl)acetyl-CoA isomerase